MIANKWYCIAQTTTFDSKCGISVNFEGGSIIFTASVRFGSSSLNISSCEIAEKYSLSVRLRETDSKWCVDLLSTTDINPSIDITDTDSWVSDNTPAGSGSILAIITDIDKAFNTSKGGDSLFEKINIGTDEGPKWAVVPKKIDNTDVGIVSDAFISSGGRNGNTGNGFGLIEEVYGYDDLGGEFDKTVLTNTFNAHSINEIYKELKSVSSGGGLNEEKLKAYLDLYNYLTKDKADKLYAPISIVNNIQWEKVNVGSEEYPKWALRPKLIDGAAVGIISDSFITSGGINGNADNDSLYNRLDKWEDYDELSGDVLSAALGYELKTLIDNFQPSTGGLNEDELEQYLKNNRYLTRDVANILFAPLDYFTDGAANNALKLGGELPSFYATSQSLTDLKNLVDKLFTAEFDNNGNLLSIKANAGLWTDEYLTSGGVNGSTGGNVFNRLDSWSNYDSNAGDVLSANLGYNLKTQIEELKAGSSLNEAELEEYLNSRNYLTKGTANGLYTPISSFNALNTKLNDFLEGSDTDNIINKWKELEAFLAGQTESSTLADLLRIKADATTVEALTKRVSTAETGIATNLENINTVKGYFTDGSANNALKLGGQFPSYYAQQSALENHISNYNTFIGSTYAGHISDYNAHISDYEKHIAAYNGHITAYNNHVAEFDSYKTTTDARLVALEALWEVDNEHNALYPKSERGIWSNSFITSGGINGNIEGDLFVRLDRWEDYNTDEGQVLSAKLGYELLQMINNGSGGSDVDLSDYVKKDELNTRLGSYVTSTSLSSTLNGYQTKITTSNKISYDCISGTPTIPSTSDFLSINGGTINGNLRLQKTGQNYGSYLYFGDNSYAYIAELSDDNLTIKASSIYLTGSVYVNGVAYSGGSSVDLSSYATKDWVTNTALDGYATTSDLGSYLPKTGGTISGSLTVNGSFYASSVTHGSDIRYKSVLQDIVEDIEVIANAPLFDFNWTNNELPTQMGTSAQYWLDTKFSNAVSYDKEKDFHSLAYGELGVGIGILNSRKLVNHESRLSVVEKMLGIKQEGK